MGFVHVYLKNINEYNESDLDRFLPMVSPARLPILQNRKQWKDKLRGAFCEIMLWEGLKNLGFDLSELAVSYDTAKPSLYDPFAKKLVEKTGMDPSAAAVGIDFSFSHSGDFCACAISDFKVGIDIQEKTDRMPLTSSHVFTKKEALAVSSAEDFLRYWTCKESFIKCVYPEKAMLTSVELNFADPIHPITNRRDKEAFFFTTKQVNENYMLSFCTKATEGYSYNFTEL